MSVITESLTHLFPLDESQIPEAWRRPEPLHQRQYLLDGELRDWSGPTQEVLTPIQTRLTDGTLAPRVIGSYPLLDEAESLKALDAAVRAYDHGRGEWPTLSVAERIADAQAKGAHVMNEGGGTAAGPLVFPALLFPVQEGMKVWREEQFGPIVPVASFSHVDQAIQYIIESDHGQQVSIFGSESKEVADLIDQLVNQVSRVNINAQCQRGPDTFPFTGRKDSAEGTLSVYDALRSFSIRTVVATKMTDANKHILNEIVDGQESSFLSTRFIL